MVWFRENWYEEVLRQLRAGLAKCHVVAFHHRAAVADATVTPHTLNFIKKVVSTFGIGIGISEYSPLYNDNTDRRYTFVLSMAKILNWEIRYTVDTTVWSR